MAISALSQSGKETYSVNNYIADTDNDIVHLPTYCAPGSACLVVSSGNVWMLNNQKKWVLLGGSSGGGGGGTLIITEPCEWEPIGTPGTAAGDWENL